MKEKKKAIKTDIKKAVSQANTASKFLAENKHLLIALGLGVGGYIVYRNIKKGLKVAENVFKADPVDFIDGKQPVNPKKLTINKRQAELMAKNLLEAFNESSLGVFGGTDEKKIKEVFSKIKTADDYRLVYNTFSRRPYLNSGTPVLWLDRKMATKKDLDQWLRSELSPSDGEVYKIVKARLKSAGRIL